MMTRMLLPLAAVGSLALAGSARADFVEMFNGDAFPWQTEDYIGGDAWGWGFNDDCYDDLSGTYRGNFTTGVGGAAHADTAYYAHAADYDLAMLSPWTVVSPGADLYYTIAYHTFGLLYDDAFVEIRREGGDWDLLKHYEEEAGQRPAYPFDQDAALGLAERLDLAAYEDELVQLRFRYAGTGSNFWMQVDDVMVIPTPASLTLVSLGGVLFGGRRPRRR